MRFPRAVKVSGPYYEASAIPDAFLDVLFHGSQCRSNLGNQESALTLAGCLVPERNSESVTSEFVKYDWNKESQAFVIANTLMAQYYGYRDVLRGKGYNAVLDTVKYIPTSGADLLARAVPFMSFSMVVDPPTRGGGGEIKTPLSAAGLPYENHYNGALWRLFDEFGYHVSQPEGTPGKSDLVVSFNQNQCTFAIETIMAYRS